MGESAVRWASFYGLAMWAHLVRNFVYSDLLYKCGRCTLSAKALRGMQEWLARTSTCAGMQLLLPVFFHVSLVSIPATWPRAGCGSSRPRLRQLRLPVL